jgi:eukaryotic-like serine/threonine-protein kinase
LNLSPGRELSHYRLVERIGEGGMGVVWKATDQTLGRAVAIKVLPAAFAQDPERMARFEREARLLASLNHPHIASIYGVGSADGVRFLAMELVEGDDLAARLSRGPMPVAETIEVARQVAEALEVAHEKGIIHRDLKPANVKLTADGQVKVLDFGLAKALDDEAPAANSSTMSHSPTLTSPMTGANVILGTAAYMSPEQSRGKLVDRRADIWAFGCVLYECLTGRRAFAGETVSDTIAKILEREPDWTALPARTPAKVRELLQRCLEKDARKRLRDIGDARVELENLIARGVSASGVLRTDEFTDAHAARRGGPATLAWSVAAVAVGVAVIAIAFPKFMHRAEIPVAARAVLTAPNGMQLSTIPADAAVSPDGTMLVFCASDSADRSRLWLRPLSSLEARPINGTEFSGAESPGLPFWSPDGKSIGFFADAKLKTVAIGGGSPQTLCNAPNARGGTWNRDGVILFAPSSQSPLFRVSQSGGEPVQVTAFDSTRHETAHRFPHFLPDGRHYSYAAFPGEAGKVNTWIGDLGSSQRKLALTANSAAIFAAPGYVIFVRDQSLMAQRFDVGALRLIGEPTQIGDAPADLQTLGTNPASASGNGVLVYPGYAAAVSHLAWYGRDGRALGDLHVPEGDYREISFSPDNRQVALVRLNSSASGDIWIADASRGTIARLTTDGEPKGAVQWTGDGQNIAYQIQSAAELSFYQRPVSGSAQQTVLFSSASLFKNLTQITRDGSYLVFDDLGRTTQRDLWYVPLKGDRKPVPYLQTPFGESGGSISPDGHWMLYDSDESGRVELYVQSFPALGTKIRVSSDGAQYGGWRDDGGEILYLSAKGLMSVSVRHHPSFAVDEPKLLMALPKELVTAGVSSDFKRFLFALANTDAVHPTLTILTNWNSLVEGKR